MLSKEAMIQEVDAMVKWMKDPDKRIERKQKFEREQMKKQKIQDTGL